MGAAVPRRDDGAPRHRPAGGSDRRAVQAVEPQLQLWGHSAVAAARPGDPRSHHLQRRSAGPAGGLDPPAAPALQPGAPHRQSRPDRLAARGATCELARRGGPHPRPGAGPGVAGARSGSGRHARSRRRRRRGGAAGDPRRRQPGRDVARLGVSPGGGRSVLPRAGGRRAAAHRARPRPRGAPRRGTRRARRRPVSGGRLSRQRQRRRRPEPRRADGSPERADLGPGPGCAPGAAGVPARG